ncbi:uncharacterized protein DUF4403 [Pontibacter ummariensis]|uniref:DUF4403 family protein n=1 Tax=Pontibacter ummariensis TaxID=1610492 RepID=A0A239J4Q5_9BACT|nr:DUF4403 family protein [Pontibacter ummariensis]PRY08888.1 uncharacterized protein DUF4403 [Pontibacter ummariensis]SNT01006.1 protein of unknown function [Pontibacter ummariensis]
MENAIKIHVPITVSYPALEGVLQKQMVGEYIPRPEQGVNELPYAQVLDVGITGSSTGAYDVILRIKIRVLRTVLKRDQVDLYVRATLGYENTTQQLFVRKFKAESRTSSSFYNTALEVLANKVAYTQILRKTRFNLSDIISKEMVKANGLLEKGLALKGLVLTGAVTEVRVQDIVPQQEQVSLSLELLGDVEVDIHDLLGLMPG